MTPPSIPIKVVSRVGRSLNPVLTDSFTNVDLFIEIIVTVNHVEATTLTLRARDRFLVDDYLIKWGQASERKDFVLKSEYVSKTKVVNRIYLDNLNAEELAEGVNSLFLRVVEIPKLHNGEKQTISTLIQEEAQLLAKYLRNERKTWIPRIPTL
jgi:hypothetical protein